MVFTTTTLFKGIPCPEGENCTLTNCIYGHDLRPKKKSETPDRISTTTTPQDLDLDSSSSSKEREPAAKRRRITYDTLADKPPSKADKIRGDLASARNSHAPKNQVVRNPPTTPHSLVKTVSPPPANNGRATSFPIVAGVNAGFLADNGNGGNSTTNAAVLKSVREVEEKLNPRLIPNDPAGHAKRALFLNYLHAEMTRLNVKVGESSQSPEHEQKQLSFLTEQELVKQALDEEEKVARDQPMVYANIIKNRIAAYKKMTLEEWKKHIRSTYQKDKEKSNPKPHPPPANSDAAEKPITTGLTPSEELLILPHLLADQTKLPKHGYIPVPPTPTAAAEAAAAVAASKNFEICDRCAARFQVFPERNEDGLLTSNGPCKYHPNKKVYPQRSKADHYTGPKEPYYPCCNAVVGSPGCTENAFHVFKSSIPARLAAVLPFITTPENPEPARDRRGTVVGAVAFDCEMGYTVFGLELIRLTAVAWPGGEELLDFLVRPVGTVIDLNSRFSGVWPQSFVDAVPWDEWCKRTPASPPSSSPPPDNTATTSTPPPPPPASLPIVESIAQARALLCTYLTPTTPLIGHAIDNDLNAVRLCHPSIIDTVLIFPHPRGLPLRYGLKMLSAKYLGRSIQMGGARGHDSLEDARATGDLVRVGVREKWAGLRRVGWVVDDVGGRLVRPEGGLGGGGGGGGEDEGGGLARGLAERAWNGGQGAAGRKRRKKRPGVDGVADESTEDEEVVPGENDGMAMDVGRKGDVPDRGHGGGDEGVTTTVL